MRHKSLSCRCQNVLYAHIMAPLTNLCCVLIAIVGSVLSEQTEVSLNGEDWTISDSKGRVKDLQAVVPGQVHLDLL